MNKNSALLRSEKNIALNVYNFFTKLGKTNEEIADDLNVSTRTVYNYMNGTRIPDIKMLIKLANYLGTKIDDLVR